LLCDLGGTHARFAVYQAKGRYSRFKKYRLNDFSTFTDIVQAYHDDVDMTFTTARFSTARTPIKGVIKYARHAGDPDYIIDFNAVEARYGWTETRKPLYLNDLEAAAHGLCCLQDADIKTYIPREGARFNDHKIVISVGTGVGHAGVMNGHIMRTTGGHWLPITVTEEQRAIEHFVRADKDPAMALIMEDVVSGRGLHTINRYFNGTEDDLKPDTVRVFFEYLGLYAHNVVSVTGFYGGAYLTGGVIDHLIAQDLTDWAAFERFMRSNMVPVVNDRLHSTPVHHVLHQELPLLGLTAIEVT